MHLNHINDYQNSMKRRLNSGITPAQFELDALRLDEMVFQAQSNAALRAAAATQPKSQRAKPWVTFKVTLSQFRRLVAPRTSSQV